jgi:hypothetical protein
MELLKFIDKGLHESGGTAPSRKEIKEGRSLSSTGATMGLLTQASVAIWRQIQGGQ